MALNKRKILDNAQKYLQKGSLDKALKEYQKILDRDPRDTNVRLKIGDVQLRRGKSEEAIEAYFHVAEQFMKDGFDAKAVALYKQITKIDPKRYEIYEPLAELYQRLGLQSEAMSALQTAAEAHQREGRKKEGLALLRKMASLDPGNTTTRLKIAELLWKEELQDDALAEYDEVVLELGRQEDDEGVVRVHEQVLSHLPQRVENLVGLGCALLDLGRPTKAEPPLLKATEVAVDSVEAWEALARVHEALGREKELEETYKTVAAIHKDRGNEERAKEILQLYVTPQGLGDAASAEPDAGVEVSREPMRGDLAQEDPDVTFGGAATPEQTLSPRPAVEEPAADDESARPVVPELEVDEDDAAAADLDLDDDIEIELDEEVPDLDGGEPPTAPPTPPSAEADPSQLLAEAGVYLRYSQHDKAVTCLEQILESEPEHRDALAKLGEARLALGETATAVVLWRRAALRARGEGDEAAFETLCGRLRELDAEAADALAAEPAPGPAAAPESSVAEADATTALPELDLTSELEGIAESAPAAEAAASSVEEAAAPSVEESAAPSADAGRAAAPELDVDVDEILESTGSSLGGETGSGMGGETGDAAVASDEAGPAASGPSDAGAFGTGGGSLGGSADTGEVSAEDLEEAEFYYRQGLYDEAEQILKRLLAVAPGHPQVLLRLGEIARSRGESPCSPVGDGVDFDTTEEDASPGVDPAAVPPAPPVDESAAFAEEDEGAADTAAADDLLSDDTIEDWDAEPATGGAPVGPDELTLQADAALGADSGGDTLGGETAPTLDDAVDDATPPQPVAADGEGFDLAAELSGIFDEEPESASGELTAGGTTQAGFESIFQSFKQGVKETLGEDEHETHYDLGIAYREMGLLEDAINEFRVAMGAPVRKLDCLALMGLCALDLGRAGDAVGHLEQALAMPGLDEQRIAGLRFDLGRAFELQGDLDRARSVWEQVLAFDPEFPDLRERLERLGQADESPSLGDLDPDLSDTGEVFESFDDLIAEAEADEVGSDGDGDDDDPDDPGGGPDDSDPGERSGDDSSGDMGSTQWGRKISYG